MPECKANWEEIDRVRAIIDETPPEPDWEGWRGRLQNKDGIVGVYADDPHSMEKIMRLQNSRLTIANLGTYPRDPK